MLLRAPPVAAERPERVRLPRVPSGFESGSAVAFGGVHRRHPFKRSGCVTSSSSTGGKRMRASCALRRSRSSRSSVLNAASLRISSCATRTCSSRSRMWSAGPG
jgi:hypothetical protein